MSASDHRIQLPSSTWASPTHSPPSTASASAMASHEGLGRTAPASSGSTAPQKPALPRAGVHDHRELPGQRDRRRPSGPTAYRERRDRRA